MLKSCLRFSVIILSLFILFNSASAQNFSKYTSITGEKHIWPGPNNARFPFLYDEIISSVSGFFTGFNITQYLQETSIVFCTDVTNFEFRIYSVECKGYRILDPKIKYNDARIVNAQEGLNLDTLGNDINGSIALSHANTEHPTIERFRDNQGVFDTVDNIKHTLSGNFYGSAKSELFSPSP